MKMKIIHTTTMPASVTIVAGRSLMFCAMLWMPVAIVRAADRVEPARYTITPVPFTDMKLTDTFWAGRQTTNRQVTVAHNFSEMEKQGSLGAFRILSGDSSEKYHGYMWGDSDVYKTIEGAQYVLRTQPNPELEKKLESLIAQIARSQAPSGFLFPHLQITEPKYALFERETSGTCESYSMGHLLESAVEHFRTTGRTNYLDVARRAADLMVKVNKEGKALQVSGHPEVEIGLVKLFQATGEQAYLDLAQRLVEGYKTHLSLWSHGKPAMGHDDVLGHAVAVMYLYAGACDVGVTKGDPALLDLLDRKWERMVGRKMYVTGGVGHSQHAEGFSDDYVLPDEQYAYCETCSAIAGVLWSSRMFQIKGDSKYYDVIERVLYNCLSSGSGLSGDRFFYANPLAADRAKAVKRWSWHGCPCCPANLVRFWPKLSEYFFAVGASDLYVNLFAACEGNASVAGTNVRLRQMTDYPWEGRVLVEVTPGKPQTFALRIRIPGWAEGKPFPSDLYRYTVPADGKVVLKLNGVDFAAPREKGYAVIQRTWKAGDSVEVVLPMPVRHVVAHEKVEAAKGKVAVERGPIVYCAEGVDNAGKVTDLALTDTAAMTLEHRPGLANGVRVIKADALRVSPHQKTTAKETMTLVPYYAWNYRGAGDMRVWLARTPETVKPEPCDTSNWIGSNYTPAYAANQIQMWHEFKPEVIERELAAAVKYFGINTLRVYLHNIVYDTEKELFLERIEAFLRICDRHGIKPGFVFFDDCWNHAGITIETPPAVDGRHNGRWAALQDVERKDENMPRFKAYVQGVIAAHREDKRVLWWEIYNEPNIGNAFSLKVREAGYGWAKEVKPTQPVIACWDDHPWTDIVNSHNYTPDFAGAWNGQADRNPAKGTVFTEAGARWFGKKPESSGSPIEVIDWLRRRKAANKYVPGVYLCWELMVGNSNCRWYWGTQDGAPEPAIPWCGLLWPDCTPVSYAEADAVRSYATGKTQSLMFEDFQSLIPQVADPPPGWTRYGAQVQASGSRYLSLSGQSKMIAGATAWGDYLLEATVMLKDGAGNAGICFRVNDPGQGSDQMHGYYLGIDNQSLYLGKMENGWKQLAAVDLAARPNKMEADTWNLLRVAVVGNHIRAWLNPVHDDTRPVLDVRDEDKPVLKGAIGLRVCNRTAWFDDVVVLPADLAPGLKGDE